MPNYILVKRFSNDVIRPLVRKMDEESLMDRSVIEGVFANGVCSLTYLNR